MFESTFQMNYNFDKSAALAMGMGVSTWRARASGGANGCQ
jgi:hypothetical protein